MSAEPLILYIPGLKPKPEPAAHREQLARCLVHGIRRIDSTVADDIEKRDDAFAIVPWTYDFYGVNRDLELDIADIDALLLKDGASAADIATATSWSRRFLRWLFTVADFLPFTVPALATDELEVHLRDLSRYVRNVDGAAVGARDKLRSRLQESAYDHRSVLLLAHSMGSVIAFDTLWEMRGESAPPIDLLLTMGSPLGQKLIQRKLLGAGGTGGARYPDSIRHWVNLAAVGELTAIDGRLKNDFSEMIELGLVADINDREVSNYYHMRGTLNVHAEYGYLVNEVTAAIVSSWWRQQTEQHSLPGSA